MRLIAFLLSGIAALLGAASLFAAFVYVITYSGRSHEETGILVLSGLGLALLVPGVLGLRVCLRGFRPSPGREMEPRPSWLLQQYGLDKRDFSRIHLPAADLNGANLSKANLYAADLSGTDLSGSDLCRADLRSAQISGANLRRTNLSEAELSGANLNRANLSEANLYKANLNEANLGEADLSGATLHDAYLPGTDLSGAHLSGANLAGATVSDAQLAQVASLKGATMPDGTDHE